MKAFCITLICGMAFFVPRALGETGVDLKALKDLIVSEKVGVVVSDLDDIVEKIGGWDGKVDPDRYVIENRIGELEELYRDAIRGG